ncbi:hypothetical protein Tco_0341357, partial [Tanacetum coccineum]
VAFDLLRDALSVIFGLSELKEINRHGMPGMHWVTFWIARLKISNTPRTLIPLRPNLGVLQIGIKSQGYREPASDEEIEGPMKDQPLSADASPTALSPGYIADSDPEEDKEDPEEDPADHPADG